MSHNNKIISAPVSIYDIKTVIAESSRDLGTLCKSSRINAYSHYKPIDYNAINIEQALRESVFKAQNWGYSYQSLSAKVVAEGLFGDYTNWDMPTYPIGYNGWGYNKPLGGSRSPFRMGDFIGYNHNVIENIVLGNMTNNTRAGKNTDFVTADKMKIMLDLGSSNYQLSEFSAFVGHKIGVVIAYSSTNIPIIKEAEYNVEEALGDYLIITLSNFLPTPSGYTKVTYRGMICVFTQGIATNDPTKTTGIVPLPIAPFEFAYSNAIANIVLNSGVGIRVTKTITASFNVTNTGNGSAYTLRYIVDWGDGTTSTLTQAELGEGETASLSTTHSYTTSTEKITELNYSMSYSDTLGQHTDSGTIEVTTPTPEQ